MSNTNTGGPAFPSGLKEEADDTVDSLHKGMTLRDYFAAKVLQGLCSLPADFESDIDSFEMAAKIAYEQADAMLKAREQ